MAEKIYIKQPGQPGIPVTVRIEWLSNGKIKPCLYWTPDGSCYEIRRVYETVSLALLKNRSEGLRFKVKAIATDCQYIQHEIYLYLADNLFCGRNIIDDRYGHECKEFITVTLDVFSNCKYELIDFEVHKTKYVVEKTLAIEPRASVRAGGIGIRHKIEARQLDSDNERTAALYFEINKWFVRVKTA